MNLENLENLMYSGSAVLGVVDYKSLPGTIDTPVKERIQTALTTMKIEYHDVWNLADLTLQEKLIKATEINFIIICLELEYRQDDAYHRICVNAE